MSGFRRFTLSTPAGVLYAGHMARRRLDVNQAAQILGISTDAVRKRARRGTLEAEKTEDGSLYIWLDGGAPDGQTPTQADLDLLLTHVEYLKATIAIRDEELRRREEQHHEEIRRKDHLLAAALERIPPQLEAPPEPADSPPVSPEEDLGKVEGLQQGDGRSWWQRLFG
jgi:hypothetical protein